MVGPTAQLVALACHVNAQAQGVRTATFFPTNSTCQFCEYIRFIRQEGGLLGMGRSWRVAADTPDQWLDMQAKRSRGAIISREGGSDPRLSDRMSAGFVGGGGKWKLWIVEGEKADVWNASWHVGNRNAPANRIWRVTYAQIATEVAHTIAAEALEPLRHRLGIALSGALAFCARHKIEGFRSQFQQAVECLSSAEPFSLIYHKDLAPAGTLTLSAQQLLAACSAAWVFGGMGSWNDLYFEGDKDSYDRISEELFVVINDSIAAATNSAAFIGS